MEERQRLAELSRLIVDAMGGNRTPEQVYLDAINGTSRRAPWEVYLQVAAELEKIGL